jgi:ornithine decarboxylase
MASASKILSDTVAGLTELIEKYKISTYPDSAEPYELIYDIIKDETVRRRPFFIVDLGQVMMKFEQWKQLLPRITPYYAVKCNPDPAIISVLGYMGCNFDCASQSEIASVQDNVNLDTDPTHSRIIFANPVKDESHIQYARANDVDLVVVDSPDELYKLKLYHSECKVFLRLHVENPHAIISFGSKFGARMEEIPRLIDICLVLELQLVGVSFHVGTGCTDSTQYRTALEHCQMIFDMARKRGIDMSYIDIGGGFPGSDTPELSFQQVADFINSSIDELFPLGSELPYTKIKFIAEPGRFFVASSHILVVNIIGKKVSITQNPDGSKKKVFIYVCSFFFSCQFH